MKRFIALMMVLMFGGVLAGCNTMEGLGQDVERGGEKLQDSAKKNR